MNEQAEEALGARRSDLLLAYCLLRAALGLNILMHGAARLLNGPTSFAAGLSHTFQNTLLPQNMVFAFGLLLPWLELLLGSLLLLGFRSRWALIAGLLLLSVLTFGTALQQNWNVAAIQLTYSLVYAILLSLHSVDSYSLDGFLKRRRLS